MQEVNFSAISADGVFMISACLDKKPMLRDGVTGDWIGTFEGHKGAVWSAKLNSDATRAATASADFSAKLWDPVVGREIAHFEHSHIVKSIDLSPDSQGAATGCKDKKLRIFDVRTAAKAGGAPTVVVHPKAVQQVLCFNAC